MQHLIQPKAFLVADSSDFIDTDAGGAAGEGSVKVVKNNFWGWFKFPDEHRTTVDLLWVDMIVMHLVLVVIL